LSKRNKKYSATDETDVIDDSSLILNDAPLNIAETAHNEVLKSALIDKLNQAPSLESVIKNPWHYSEWLATLQQLVS
jgi:hypothetical protein